MERHPYPWATGIFSRCHRFSLMQALLHARMPLLAIQQLLGICQASVLSETWPGLAQGTLLLFHQSFSLLCRF